MSDLKTFIVVGVPRGGTSMVAGLLRLFGIFMGDIINGAYGDKHEDKEFYCTKDKRRIAELINKRNIKHDVWGFKDPGIAPYIETTTELRDPHYIYIIRDALACGMSAANRNPNKETMNSMARAMNYTKIIMDFYFKNFHKYKFHMMSYEKTLLNKEYEIRRLAKFCGTPVKDLDVDIKHLIKFVSPGYKSLKDERGDWTNCFHEDYFNSDKKGLPELKSTIRPARAWEDPDADAEEHIKLLEIDGKFEDVLEIGCGIGRIIKVLSEKHNKTCMGIDASEKMVLHSKDYVKGVEGVFTKQCQPNGHFKMNERPLFPGVRFGLIFSIITFQHIPSTAVVKNYIAASYGHLKKGGRLTFQILRKDFLKDTHILMHYHSEGVLMDHMNNLGFKNISKREVLGAWIIITGVK